MSHKFRGTLTDMRNAAREESLSHPPHSDTAKNYRAAAAAYQVAIDAAEDGHLSLDEMIVTLSSDREEWRDNANPNVYLAYTAAINRLRGLKTMLS
jgi:hypothetical protein